MTYSNAHRILFAVAIVSALAGCSDRAPINRVQPDFLDKQDLIPNQYAVYEGKTDGSGQSVLLTEELIAKEPVFYTQTTLIDKPTTVGFTGLTSYSDTDKIRWEVTERQLIARQAYEFVAGAPSGQGGIGNAPQTGSVVAAYAISSHFDIRRAYNPTTGEELNIIEENSSDRPWYQRRYMRVDWSANLIDGYNSVFGEAEIQGRVSSEPVPVFVNTPNDPNAPLFVYSGEEAARRLDYFDVVNRAVLHPETTSITFEDHPGSPTTYSKLPLCYLNNKEGSMDCAPAEVTFRVAFRRVDRTRDYEPASLTLPFADADGAIASTGALDMERFGFFDTMRIGYDGNNHNISDSRRIHFASRHNLWVHHHVPKYLGDVARACNVDVDCAQEPAPAGERLACRIGPSPVDDSHRGRCARIPEEDPYLKCSSDFDCQSYDALSRCDLAVAYTRADNRGLCLLPFEQRQVRPIAYHESENYPERMQAVTEAIVGEWNDAFAQAVQAARRHECEIRRGIDAAATLPEENPCSDSKVIGTDDKLGADARFVFVGCHSPVWGTEEGAGQHSQAEVAAAHAKGWDLAACGPQGTNARLGDLRYSMIGSINDHDAQGYWGLANIAADRETGEMVIGRGAVWQTITEFYAAHLVDLVKVLNGDASPTTIANGANIISSMEQMGAGRSPSAQMIDAPMKGEGALEQVAATPNGIDRLRLADAGWFKPELGMTLRSRDPGKEGALALSQKRIFQGGLLGDGTSRGTQRLLSLAGTSIEGRMMNPEQARLAATASPDDNAVLPQTLNDASPLRMQSAQMRNLVARFRAKLSAFQCGMEASFSDDVLLGLAERLAKGAPISKSDPLDARVAFGRDWDFRASGAMDYKLLHEYAVNFIHHGVLAHEIGHSLGQRHNFTASADALNYDDRYWAARGLGHPKGLRPRYEYLADPADGKYYSAEEIAGRIEEFAYSSVMDYKGLNEDAQGIGRYDYAFVKNGYLGMVEAFREVADRPGAITYAMNTAGGGFSTPLDLRAWSTGGAVKGMHYTQIPELFGRRTDGTPNIGNDNRYDVFLWETTFESVPGFGPPQFSNATADGHVLVPYRFDTDDRAGLVWQDQRFDSGADAYESLRYMSSRLVDYYFVNSFARLRSGFSTAGYVSRMWGRALDQMRQTTQMLAFDLINWEDFFAGSPGWDAFKKDPAVRGGYINQAAMNVTANAFVGLLTMPDMGTHLVRTQTDGVTQLYTPGPSSGLNNMSIEMNDGRAFESSWRSDAGFWWYEHLNRAGSYYDKVMALQAISDPELRLLGRDTPTDIRLFQLSFYTMFPEQMTRLFGGLLAEDYNDFAPIYATQNNAIQRTNVSTLSQPGVMSGRVIDANHRAIDPQTHFTVQLWAAVQTISQFPATYDQTYMDFARLWVDGGNEAITVADPATQTVWFTDPWSHLTYRALHFGCGSGENGAAVGCSATSHPGGGGNEAGIAARMILHARDLDAKRLAASSDETRAAIELEEKKYLDLISVTRNLTAHFGTGTSELPQ